MRRPALCLAVLACSLAACGGPSDDEQVRDTLERYEQATAKRDVQTICDELLSPEIAAKVAREGLPCEVALKTGLEDVKAPTLRVEKVQVNGDQALARVRSEAAGQAPSTDTIRLIRIGETWRIAALARPQPQPPTPAGP